MPGNRSAPWRVQLSDVKAPVGSLVSPDLPDRPPPQSEIALVEEISEEQAAKELDGLLRTGRLNRSA